MKTYFKKDLFITIKSHYWWILLIVCMCFVCLFSTVKYYQTDLLQDNLQNVNAVISENAHILERANNNIFSYCEFIFCSDALLMFIGIFSILLCMQEFNDNYIKNTWNIISKKSTFFLSKMIIVALFICLTFIITTVVVTVYGKFVLNIDEMGNYKDFIVMCLKQFVLELAFCIMMMSIAILIRKQIIIIIGFVVYVALGQTLIYAGINLLVKKVLQISASFDVGKYLLYGNIERITMEAGKSDSIRALLISSAVIILCSILSSTLLSKKDAI